MLAGGSTDGASMYKNVDYIVGSAAEVERLWSTVKHILTSERTRLTPILLEALVYLKVNSDYWGIEEVVKANENVDLVARDGGDLEEALAEDAAFLADQGDEAGQ